MTRTVRDLDVLAYELGLSKVLADDGKAFDRVSEALRKVAEFRALTNVLAREVPLRRLVWKVIREGELIRVADVTARLRVFGVEPTSVEVSNALGHLVRLGAMERVRKGLYRWPWGAA